MMTAVLAPDLDRRELGGNLCRRFGRCLGSLPGRSHDLPLGRNHGLSGARFHGLGRDRDLGSFHGYHAGLLGHDLGLGRCLGGGGLVRSGFTFGRLRSRSQRHGDGGAGTALHHVAERLQDRGEVLACAADQRGHGHGGYETIAIGRTGRRLAGGDARAIGDGRADQVGQTLQDVHTHGTAAADAEACGTVEARRDLRIDRDRGATGLGKMGDLIDSLLVEAAVLERPELRREHARGGLQKGRQV